MDDGCYVLFGDLAFEPKSGASLSPGLWESVLRSTTFEVIADEDLRGVIRWTKTHQNFPTRSSWQRALQLILCADRYFVIAGDTGEIVETCLTKLDAEDLLVEGDFGLPVAWDRLPFRRWLTVREAAHLLEIAVSTIYAKLRCWQLPGAYKAGHRWRIDAGELRDSLQPRTAPV